MASWTRVVAAVTLALLWIATTQAQQGAAPPAVTPPSGRSFDCYQRMPADPVNLSLRDASTQSTLRLLAQNYRVNMVVTDDVTGTVTLDFYRAPIRDVFQAILDSNGLVCVKQGELLRVSTAERLVKDEKGRVDAVSTSVTRDAEISRRFSEAQKQAADSAIQLATAQVIQRNAELVTQRGEIRQEIVRIKYQDAGVIGRTVVAIVGIGPNVQIPACRFLKQDEKLNAQTIDPVGGGGASSATEAEKSAVNIARATAGNLAIGVPAQPGPIVGPPGGLGALPPFSALFGPQPPPPPAAPPEVTYGSGFGNLSGGESSPTVRTDCQSNSLILRLYDEQMKRAKEAIERQLDVLPPQVKIESRLELLDREDLFALGVQWGGGGLLGISNGTAVVGRGFTSGQNNNQGSSTAGFGFPGPNPGLGTSTTTGTTTTVTPPLSAVIPVNGTTGLAAGGNIVNLPIAGLLDGAAASGGGGIAFGIIGNRMDLNLALEALRLQNRSQSLARPEVVVADSQKALVSIGEEIPYSTISSAGTSIQFKNALLELQVIPAVICRNEPPLGRTGGTHRLRMLVRVENSTRGLPVDLGPNGSPPAINTQKTQTDMMMVEGARLVIGGITQNRTRDQVRKVPLLGDVPVLGWLFKQKGTDEQRRELVVFLTPTVLVPPAPQAAPVCPSLPVAVKAN